MKKTNIASFTVKDLTQVAVMSAAIAVCSWISIPMPVPFTFQTFGVFSALMLLGGGKGTLSIFLYIILGAIGLPVFASFGAGVGVLFGPTGGYIVGFLIIGLLYWTCSPLCKNAIMKNVILIIGLLLCYLLGTVWYAKVLSTKGSEISMLQGLLTCVVPYILPDLAKLILAAAVAKRIAPRL